MKNIKSTRRRILLAAALACALPLTIAPMAAQSAAWQPGPQSLGPQSLGLGPSQANQSVQLTSGHDLAVAGARPTAELTFAINQGLHINSHTPHSKFLIPTRLTLHAPTGVQIAAIDYPSGKDYRFQFDPKNPVSVYTGNFSVLVHLAARPGRYRLEGGLRYQACDARACNPPKTLPLTLSVTAK